MSHSPNYEKIIKNLEMAISRKKKELGRKTYKNHPKSNFFFSKYPPEIRKKLMYDDEALFSVTDSRSADKITEILSKLDGISKSSVITDMTACVGGNSISFSNYFRKVNSIELDEKRFEILKYNIEDVLDIRNIEFFNGNGIDLIMNNSTHQDIIFMDPPWGGTNYKKSNTLRLSLTNQSGNHYDMGELTLMILKKAKYVALKVPVNFDVTYFREVVNKHAYVLSEISSLRKMKLLIVGKKKPISKMTKKPTKSKPIV
jgi:16S rRNA G966 N2-methylase RsmD